MMFRQFMAKMEENWQSLITKCKIQLLDELHKIDG